MPPSPRMPAWVTAGVLTLCGLIVSLQQTLVIPLLPDMPEILGVSADDASWLVTATLLTGAVATPIVARMADMYGKRRMLLISLLVMTAGSLVAALGGSFGPLIVGRAMQGFGASLIPVGISIMRDQLPREKLAGAISLMSATFGIGAALGLPLSGLIHEAFGWTALFWSTAVVGAVLIVVIRLMLTESVPGSSGRFDVAGALILSIALVALLLILSKGAAWGWTSVAVAVLAGVAVVAFAVWVPLQLRTPEPMVNLRTAVKRPMLLTNVASFFVGFSMLMNSLITTQELQVPTETGYGMALPVVTAGLLMVPGGLMMLVFSPISGRMLNRLGGKPTLLIGSATIGLAYLGRVLAPDSVVTTVVGNTVISVGTAVAFAAMPTLVMATAHRSETASANGVNSLIRSLGTSSSSAVVAMLFASMAVVVDGTAYPSAAGMDVALWLGAATAAIAVLVGALIPVRGGEESGEEREHGTARKDGYHRLPSKSS
ncbi:MFS transporter [Nocardiopsis algeriensis]|uniref:Putative MFS family arabinose efflux permease n=1 Tax=Nocardiopsis algeriensis TaxID=1478215 RepID=A0A841IK38_9ACTN|nr:MFS transporter [Nocardiopsis algeriensis]MBB6119139.1 putative MFS family arabinose efflux permease [Nocardiopsis algeriensis]